MEGPRGTRDPPPRPLARHLSDADRLRKVIQELMDTEKSYVKVTEGAACSSLLSAPPPTPRGGRLSAGVPGSHVPGTPAVLTEPSAPGSGGLLSGGWARGQRAGRTWKN